MHWCNQGRCCDLVLFRAYKDLAVGADRHRAAANCAAHALSGWEGAGGQNRRTKTTYRVKELFI